MPTAMNEPITNPPALNPPVLELRDIHLPEPVSWWPVAPGWWLLIIAVLLMFLVIFISRRIYRSRQLKREITAELETIKQQFQQSNDKAQLAKALSVLLRRASITFDPAKNIAGLTDENWLAYLDETFGQASGKTNFHSETGKVLLTAPYLPDNAEPDFDAQALINLCESWLLSAHKQTRRAQTP